MTKYFDHTLFSQRSIKLRNRYLEHLKTFDKEKISEIELKKDAYHKLYLQSKEEIFHPVSSPKSDFLDSPVVPYDSDEEKITGGDKF